MAAMAAAVEAAAIVAAVGVAAVMAAAIADLANINSIFLTGARSHRSGAFC